VKQDIVNYLASRLHLLPEEIEAFFAYFFDEVHADADRLRALARMQEPDWKAFRLVARRMVGYAASVGAIDLVVVAGDIAAAVAGRDEKALRKGLLDLEALMIEHEDERPS